MSTALHNAPPPMFQTIAEAMCDRPEDIAPHRDARFREVDEAVAGLQPHGAVETMLAGLAVTHAHLIEHSARDVRRGQDELLTARTKSTIVALDRGMLGFLKELRHVQAKRLASEQAAGASPAPLANATVEAAAKPTPRRSPPVAAAPAGLPEGLVPPLRRAETSYAAAMAVLSPSMPPYKVFADRKRSADAPGLALQSGPPAIPPMTMRPASEAPVKVHNMTERRAALPQAA